MEETVRAFNWVIEKGWVSDQTPPYPIPYVMVPRLTRMLCAQAFYWATSEWSARQIEEAYRELPSFYYTRASRSSDYSCTADVADKLGLVGPIAEQCQHQCVWFPCSTARRAHPGFPT